MERNAQNYNGQFLSSNLLWDSNFSHLFVIFSYGCFCWDFMLRYAKELGGSPPLKALYFLCIFPLF